MCFAPSKRSDPSASARAHASSYAAFGAALREEGRDNQRQPDRRSLEFQQLASHAVNTDAVVAGRHRGHQCADLVRRIGSQAAPAPANCLCRRSTPGEPASPLRSLRWASRPLFRGHRLDDQCVACCRVER